MGLCSDPGSFCRSLLRHGFSGQFAEERKVYLRPNTAGFCQDAGEICDDSPGKVRKKSTSVLIEFIWALHILEILEMKRKQKQKKII